MSPSAGGIITTLLKLRGLNILREFWVSRKITSNLQLTVPDWKPRRKEEVEGEEEEEEEGGEELEEEEKDNNKNKNKNRKRLLKTNNKLKLR